jgi:phage baseplate assembly protein W
MAYNVGKISPIDFEKSTAVGLSLPFSGLAVFNQTYTSQEAIKTNIINFFLTGVGERYMNPTFGTRLRNLLFEQIEAEVIEDLKDTIREDMGIYFPTVEIRNLSLIAYPDYNTVTFTISYAVENTNIEDEVVINFEQ